MFKGHGNELHLYKSGIRSDFSSNVWYKQPQELKNYLSNKLADISNYPEPEAERLKKKLAHFYCFHQDNVMVVNGSIEAFFIIAQFFRNTSSGIVYPAFSEYEDACRLYDHKLSFYKNNDDWYKRKFEEKLIWFCNPNNPDAKLISIEVIETILIENSGTIFILDEAYADLCYGFRSAISLIDKYPNLIVVKSFTKTFSIPGIRLGYMLGNKNIINDLKKYKIPWSVNSIALDLGLFILENYKNMIPCIDEVFRRSKDFQNALKGCNSLFVYPSKCNFFLVKLKDRLSSELKSYLIKQHRILIRDASNFRGLNKKFIRLAVQDQQRNEELIHIIKSWLADK